MGLQCYAGSQKAHTQFLMRWEWFVLLVYWLHVMPLWYWISSTWNVSTEPWRSDWCIFIIPLDCLMSGNAERSCAILLCLDCVSGCVRSSVHLGGNCIWQVWVRTWFFCTSACNTCVYVCGGACGWILPQNRVSRGPPGSYNQQQGGGYRPPGPPQQWGGPPTAPPPYGYQQAPQYPGPPQQYQQGPPPAYGQYPQQPAAGYATGWDQRSPAPAAQPQQQTSYDYYGQQGQQVAFHPHYFEWFEVSSLCGGTS